MTAEQDAAARAMLELYADTLELTHGPCLAGRPALMDWLVDQFQRLARLDAPDDAAAAQIDTAYMLWQADALGLDIND